MATYVRAGLPEVATALATLTGEAHPLAISPPPRDGHRSPPVLPQRESDSRRGRDGGRSTLRRK
jgi:hypothetical protein